MPSVPDPIQNEPEAAQKTAENPGSPNSSLHVSGAQGQSQDGSIGITIKADIDIIEHQDIELEKNMIGSVPCKVVNKFQDPYKYDESNTQDGEDQPVSSSPDEEDQKPFDFTLGKNRVKDSENGDAGCYLKTTKYFPIVSFIRSSFCSKQVNNILHPDINQPAANSKIMREYLVTSGIIIAYRNTFEVENYNFQTPNKDNVPMDYSHEYFGKIMVQRKLNTKKKNEKTLS